MDRELGRVATLTADLPGGDDDVIDITITDPYGTVLVDAETVPSLGSNRYVFTTTDTLDQSGIYQIDWHYTASDRTIQQLFSVGVQPVAGINKYDLRINIAARVAQVARGTVTTSDNNAIADDTIIASPEKYNYWWIMLNPNTTDAGRRFRVRGYNGSAMELGTFFIDPPDADEEYALFEIDPRELDNAMYMAINEMARQVRTSVRLEAITVTDDLVTLPRGITHVSEVWADGVKLAPSAWLMRSGRRIGFESTPDDPVDIIAQREAAFPQWEDSIVETDASSTVARAAFLLHANRAGGAAIDTEEHLRRQLAAADDYERARRTAIGRIPPGTRSVIE